MQQASDAFPTQITMLGVIFARHPEPEFRKKMECTVSWTGNAGARSSMGFVAETGSGHVLMMDGAPDAAKPENGGQNLAARPMETVLAGTGGCTAYDVVLILKRGRHQVERCSVKLTSERAEKDPKVFTKIHMHFTVAGKGIPASAVERAIALSHETYCSCLLYTSPSPRDS